MDVRSSARRGRALLATTAATAGLAALAGLWLGVARAQADHEARLHGMEAEIERLRGELRSLEGRESGLLGELERLGAEQRLREAERERVGLRREALRGSIGRHSARLRELERSQGEREDYLSFRLRELYKSGPEGELRRVVGGSGIDGYWEGVRYAAYLSERDARVLRAYRLDATRLREEREGMRAEERKLAASEEELARASAALEATRARRATRIESIRADQSKRRTAIEELESAAQELSRLVEGLDRGAEEPRLAMRPFRGLLDWPSDGEVSAGFGTVVHPRFKTRVPHPGLDIDAESGARIHTVFDGRVVFADWMRGYGLTVIVDHGDGLLSIYAHASVLMVEPGEQVARGQSLGLVGDTGSLRGAYLYFELRDGGAPTDPRAWLRPR